MNSDDNPISHLSKILYQKDSLLWDLRMGRFNPDDTRIEELFEVLKQIQDDYKEKDLFPRSLMNNLWYLWPFCIESRPKVEEWSPSSKTEYTNFLSDLEMLLSEIFGYPQITQSR